MEFGVSRGKNGSRQLSLRQLVPHRHHLSHPSARLVSQRRHLPTYRKKTSELLFLNRLMLTQALISLYPAYHMLREHLVARTLLALSLRQQPSRCLGLYTICT